MKCQTLQKDMHYLFDCDFFDEGFDPDGNEEHQKFAEAVLSTYKWDDIYNWFFSHLTKDCLASESVYNALNLYYCYCFDEHPIRNPYEMIGYILFRIDLENQWDKYGDFVDSFVNSTLEKSGSIDLVKNPYYQCWKDPVVLHSIENWKSNFKNKS